MKGFIEVTELSYESSTKRDKFGLFYIQYFTTEYKQSIAVSDIKRVLPEGYSGHKKCSLVLNEFHYGENIFITVKETYEETKKKIAQAQGELK